MYEPKTEQVLPGGIPESKLSDALHPLPDRASLNDAEKAAFDRVMERSKRFFHSIPANKDKEYHLTAYYRILLQSPLIAEMWSTTADLFQTAESRGTFSSRARDMVQVALVPVLKEQLDRMPPNPIVPLAYAIESGITPNTIKAIWDGLLDELSPDDRLLAEYVQATARGMLEPRHFERLVAFMGIKAAVEYTSFISYKIGLFRNIQALHGIEGAEMDDSIAQEFLQAHLEGKVASSDYGGGVSWVSKA